MKEYKIRITETLTTVVTVAANDAAEAQRIVKKEWENGEHIMSEHYQGVKFTIERGRPRER